MFGRWVRAMPIFKDCPRRLPGMLSSHLSSLIMGPHEDIMAGGLLRTSTPPNLNLLLSRSSV